MAELLDRTSTDARIAVLPASTVIRQKRSLDAPCPVSHSASSLRSTAPDRRLDRRTARERYGCAVGRSSTCKVTCRVVQLQLINEPKRVLRIRD